MPLHLPAPLLFLAALTARASLLMLVALAAHLLLVRRGSAAARHLVWALTVGALLLLPALTLLLPRWSVAIAPAPATAPRVIDAPVTGTRVVPAPAVMPSPESAGELDSRSPAAAPRREGTGTGEGWPFGPIALGVYLTGAALLLVRLLREQRALQALERRGALVREPVWEDGVRRAIGLLAIRRPVRVVRVDGAAMPMTWGSLRPVVSVPSAADAWTDERRNAVILHELAHVARYDCLTRALAAVACALFWFHPGVWLVARQLRRESELACDDRVLLAGVPPRDYAGELLAVARSFSAASSPALAVSMASPLSARNSSPRPAG